MLLCVSVPVCDRLSRPGTPIPVVILPTCLCCWAMSIEDRSALIALAFACAGSRASMCSTPHHSASGHPVGFSLGWFLHEPAPPIGVCVKIFFCDLRGPKLRAWVMVLRSWSRQLDTVQPTVVSLRVRFRHPQPRPLRCQWPCQSIQNSAKVRSYGSPL